MLRENIPYICGDMSVLDWPRLNREQVAPRIYAAWNRGCWSSAPAGNLGLGGYTDSASIRAKSPFSGRTREKRPRRIAVKGFISSQSYVPCRPEGRGLQAPSRAPERKSSTTHPNYCQPWYFLSRPTLLFSISLITDNRNVSYFRNR